MTSTEFVEAVRERLSIGDRQVRFEPHSRFDDSWDTVFIHYFNLPEGLGGAGGGAERENNRLMLVVRGFGRRQHDPAPHGKVKVETSNSSLRNPKADPNDWKAGRWNLRAKTATPEKIAEYVADFLNKTAAEIPPRLTHTRGYRSEWEA